MKPVLNYAASVWSPYTVKYMNKLEAIEKHAAWFIMSDFRGTSSISETNNEKLFKLSMKNYVRILMIIYKFVELPLPDYIILASEETTSNLYSQQCLSLA